MSMVINLVEDHNIYLCEGGPVYNGGVQPTPITYLTQWKIVGNSEVHTDPYITSWKVSGNSVVDNNTILSCGDLGQDGKYHVKISNGVDIYDIALNEPLRKVNDVADTIEYVDGVTTVTRVLKSRILTSSMFSVSYSKKFALYVQGDAKGGTYDSSGNILIAGLTKYSLSYLNTHYIDENVMGTSLTGTQQILITDPSFIKDGVIMQAFKDFINGRELIYELATPTTELVDAPQIAVSPTDTYTSANATPYSAFEHTEHSEIWSCGEYNPTDGKYHILVQPQGGSIADIALDEPLRKVNNVADTIEFPSGTEGKALVTRNVDVKTVSAFNNTDGSQLITTLPDDIILHIQNLIATVNSVTLTELTVTVNADNSLSIVGDNTTGSYIFQQIGTTYSNIPLSNYTYVSGIAGGSQFSYDVRYGGNMQVFDKQKVIQNTVEGKNIQIMLRSGASVNDTLYPTFLDLNVMFANAPSLMPTTTRDFITMFPNVKVIPFSNDVVDAIVHDGKLYKEDVSGIEILVPLASPTTELVDAPQIEEAESYTCVISQGGKAVSWSSFETE